MIQAAIAEAIDNLQKSLLSELQKSIQNTVIPKRHISRIAKKNLGRGRFKSKKARF